MLFNFNNQEVKQVTFNGNTVNFINLNGVRVWANIPGVPAPSHSSVTTSSVVISWTAVDRANSYTVLLGGSTYTTSNTQITINNLSHNTSFNYQVKANGDGGSSEYSTAKSFTTSQLSLSTPSVSTSKTTSSVTLSWSAISNATQYRIVFNGTTYTQTGTSKTISGLSHNTSYGWQVRAEDTSGSGASKYASSSYASGNVTTTQAALATPSVSTSKTTSSVTLSWSAISNATQYRIVFNGTTYTQTGTSKTISGLSHNTSYGWQVRAEDTSGSGASKYASSSYASGSTTTTQATLSTPSVSTSKTTSSVTLSWSAISNATQYRIVFNGTTYTQTGTSKTISGLSHNTSYSWQVRAEDTSGSGASKYASSSYASGSTTTTQATLATPSPSATSTTVSITVTWSQITNAEGYIVKFAGTNYTVSGGSTTSKTFSSLIPNTSYEYQVQATDSGGSGSGKYINSAFSAAKSINTQKISGQVLFQINTPSPTNISAGFNMLTVPQYVDVVSAVCVGGGGGAGGSGNNLGYSSGLSSGGGGGGALSYGQFSINNSIDRYFVTKVGSKGLGTYSDGEDGGRTFIYLVNNIGTTVYRTDSPSYDIYVDLYEDLIAYYNNNIAGSGTSKWSWGKSHWEANGKSEGRWLTGEIFLSSYGGIGGKLASPSLGTYQSNTQGYGGVSISTAYRIAGYSGGTGGLASRNFSGGGGGGAAGYAGAGGSGRYGNSNVGYSTSPTIPSANSGAAAGGFTGSSYCYGGGGVSLYGNSSTATSNAQGGSGGSSGSSSGLAGSYGGGGGSDDDDTERAGGNGGVGGIRLVWGNSSRYYPNSNPDV